MDTYSSNCVTPQIYVDFTGASHVVWQHGELVGFTIIPGRVIRYANSLDNFATSKILATGNHTQIPRIAGTPAGTSFWVTWRFKNTTTNQYYIKAATSYDRGATFNHQAEPLNASSSSIDSPSPSRRL